METIGPRGTIHCITARQPTRAHRLQTLELCTQTHIRVHPAYVYTNYTYTLTVYLVINQAL